MRWLRRWRVVLAVVYVAWIALGVGSFGLPLGMRGELVAVGILGLAIFGATWVASAIWHAARGTPRRADSWRRSVWKAGAVWFPVLVILAARVMANRDTSATYAGWAEGLWWGLALGSLWLAWMMARAVVEVVAERWRAGRIRRTLA